MNRIHLIVVAIVVAAASGCGDKKAPASGKASIVIGSVAPLTGGIAHLGKDNENGARLAIEEANAANPKIDGKDVVFDLISLDDQADPKVGTTVAQKLVDTKVAGVVGHLNSGVTIPASAIYNGANPPIPMITGSATKPHPPAPGLHHRLPSGGPARPPSP